MSVFYLPSDVGGLAFQSFWDVKDLTAGFSGDTLTLSPNTSIARDVTPGHPDYSFWWKPDGSGNKIMDAVLFVGDDSFAGQEVTFSGNVLSNDLVISYRSLHRKQKA